ncbi:MAG: hypothetical protein M1815_000072 [Lichina confinis]|nr:MAG: hypothetical protein M1815_000072 [Lichina confinis]
MFLRKLEYYRGIMFLTTNRVKDFDEAMQSRIHLAIKYPVLNQETRRTLWEHFLKRGVDSEVNGWELGKLAERRINGRQIKNAVQLAHEWASYEESSLKYSYLEQVLDMGREFECDFAGHDPIERLNAYN